MKPGVPYNDVIWSEAETWSRDRIENHQFESLQRQLAYVQDHSTFYRERFVSAGFDARDFKSFDDLRKLPPTRKVDYLASIDAAPPWGTALACEPEDICRVHFSSGTTARPAHVCWTFEDVDRWADLFARYFYGQGLRRHDVYQIMVSYAWFVGGMAITQGVERLGATGMPAGNQDTERQIETMFRYGTTALFMTPSFAAYLAETALALGRDLRDSKVRLIGLGGEPGGGIAATRARIEALWGVRPHDCYGMIEFQPTAWEMEGEEGLILADDFIYSEVIDPVTEQPVDDGQPGILVLTHLDKRAVPFVRWWTGDMVVRTRAVGATGRTHSRLVGGILGRADDMLIVRGVNLFPSAIEDVLRAMPGVASEYQIVLDKSLKDASGFLTGIKLNIEAEGVAVEGLADAVGARIREKLQVRALVTVVPPRTIPRAVHKATRIIRLDED
jgi:phenylacetate-CoA ligase